MAIDNQGFQPWKNADIQSSAFVIVGSDVRFFEGIGERVKETTSDDSRYEVLSDKEKAFFNTQGFPEIAREALREWEKVENETPLVMDSERFIQWCDHNAAAFEELENIDIKIRDLIKQSEFNADLHGQIAHLDQQSNQLQEKMHSSLTNFNLHRELGPVVTLEDSSSQKDTVFQSLRDKIKDIWNSDSFDFLKVFKKEQESEHAKYCDQVLSAIKDDDQVVITRSPLCILKKDGSEYMNFVTGNKVTEQEFMSLHSVNDEVRFIDGAAYKQWATENKDKICKEFEAAMHSNTLSALGDSFMEQQQTARDEYTLIHKELMEALREKSNVAVVTSQVTNTATPSPSLH